MKIIFNQYIMHLTSGFESPSLLKDRINMLYQQPSHNIRISKFLFALPVICLCLCINACIKKEINFVPQKITIEAGKVQNFSIVLEKGKAYAISIEAVSGDFKERKAIFYQLNDTNTKKELCNNGFFVIPKRLHKTMMYHRDGILCKTSGVHQVKVNSMDLKEDAYFVIQEVPYYKLKRITISSNQSKEKETFMYYCENE